MHTRSLLIYIFAITSSACMIKIKDTRRTKKKKNNVSKRSSVKSNHAQRRHARTVNPSTLRCLACM